MRRTAADVYVPPPNRCAAGRMGAGDGQAVWSFKLGLWEEAAVSTQTVLGIRTPASRDFLGTTPLLEPVHSRLNPVSRCRSLLSPCFASSLGCIREIYPLLLTPNKPSPNDHADFVVSLSSLLIVSFLLSSPQHRGPPPQRLLRRLLQIQVRSLARKCEPPGILRKLLHPH